MKTTRKTSGEFVSSLDPMLAALAGEGVDLDLSAGEGVVAIEGFRAPGRRELGTRALSALCGAADDANVVLSVVPEPILILVDDPMPLEAFYRRHGFRRFSGGEWRREPRR